MKRLIDIELDLPKPEDAPKKGRPAPKIPFARRINWNPISPMQAKNIFGVRYFSRRIGATAEYAIARNPESLDSSWEEISTFPKGAELQYGKDPETKKLVCRMTIFGLDTRYYISGRSGEKK